MVSRLHSGESGTNGCDSQSARFLTVGAPAPLQRAGVAAMQLPPQYYDDLARLYEQKRSVILQTLDAVLWRGKLQLSPLFNLFVVLQVGFGSCEKANFAIAPEPNMLIELVRLFAVIATQQHHFVAILIPGKL